MSYAIKYGYGGVQEKKSCTANIVATHTYIAPTNRRVPISRNDFSTIQACIALAMCACLFLYTYCIIKECVTI